MARGDVCDLRRGMDPPLTALIEAEVLDGVGHVHLVARDARGRYRAIQQLSRRPDEGLADQIFTVAGLFADQHETRALRAFAEDDLCCVVPQLAAAAVLRSGTQLHHVGVRRHPPAGTGAVGVCCHTASVGVVRVLSAA